MKLPANAANKSFVNFLRFIGSILDLLLEFLRNFHHFVPPSEFCFRGWEGGAIREKENWRGWLITWISGAANWGWGYLIMLNSAPENTQPGWSEDIVCRWLYFNIDIICKISLKSIIVKTYIFFDVICYN